MLHLHNLLMFDQSHTSPLKFPRFFTFVACMINVTFVRIQVFLKEPILSYCPISFFTGKEDATISL